MKRRTRSLAWLVLALAVLTAAVQLQLRHERAQALDPLTALDTHAVRRLVVECRGCATRRFERIDGHWRMLEPRTGAADPEAMASLLAIANAPVRYRHAAGDIDPVRVGLVPPQATLRLDATVLTFGGTDAIHGDRYVAIGDAIALVPDRFSVRLFSSPGSELAGDGGDDEAED
jgi:hypothetical protein